MQVRNCKHNIYIAVCIAAYNWNIHARMFYLHIYLCMYICAFCIFTVDVESIFSLVYSHSNMKTI